MRCCFSVILFLTGWFIGPTNSNEFCCSKIREKENFSECFSACTTLFLSTSNLKILERAANVYWRCPRHVSSMNSMWTCLLDNYPVVSAVEQWEGRACCEKSTSVKCREACSRAYSRHSLPSQCSEEGDFNFCLDRFQGSEQCCRDASTIECRMACRAYFSTSEKPRVELNDTCHNPSELQRISRCVIDQTGARRITDTALSLPCCELATTAHCETTCRHNLTTSLPGSEQAVLQSITKACTKDWYLNDMWTCFLRISMVGTEQEDSAVEPQPKWDYARFACCGQARTQECRTLCTTFYTSWHRWEEFSSQCLESSEEEALQGCVNEVEQPCTAGCNDLQFCSNFNSRPDTRFRMCNGKADSAAREALTGGQQRASSEAIEEGGFGWLYRLPLRNMSVCEPRLWTAVVCALQIKPCTPHTHSNKICKSDCVSILTACGRFAQDDPFIPDALCNNLPVVSSDPNKCISIQKFTEPSPYTRQIQEITHPCHPNPCSPGQVCEVRRSPCLREPCSAHRCLWACKMGPTSNLLVPNEQTARIIQKTDAEGRECHKTCVCGASKGMPDGELSSCSELECEHTPSSCTIGDNFCSGCGQPSFPCAAASTTGLPCNCYSTYLPVCSSHGRTFDNPCLAECAGYGEDHYEFGACATQSPCSYSPCSSGEKCVAWRHTCIGLRPGRHCPQYRCIGHLNTCDTQPHTPVCDSEGNGHINLCALLAARKKMAYRGHCIHADCRDSGIVCGVNGENYVSECAAWATNVAVDYYSSCCRVGNFSRSLMTRSACSGIVCPPRLPHGCKGVLAPGSCCPICGALLRVSYSRVSINALLSAGTFSKFTLHRWTHRLRSHITISECDVFTYLSDEDHLVAIVMPVSHSLTKLQVLACNSEAQNIAVLINTRSPVLFSSAELSVVARADLQTAEFTESHSVAPAKASSNSGCVVSTRSGRLFSLMFGCVCWLLIRHR